MNIILTSLRKEKQLSLKELAELSGVGKSTIGNYAKGRTRISDERLKMIADALGVTPKVLRQGETMRGGIVAEGTASPPGGAAEPWTLEERVQRIENILLEILGLLTSGMPKEE